MTVTSGLTAGNLWWRFALPSLHWALCPLRIWATHVLGFLSRLDCGKRQCSAFDAPLTYSWHCRGSSDQILWQINPICMLQHYYWEGWWAEVRFITKHDSLRRVCQTPRFVSLSNTRTSMRWSSRFHSPSGPVKHFTTFLLALASPGVDHVVFSFHWLVNRSQVRFLRVSDINARQRSGFQDTEIR